MPDFSTFILFASAAMILTATPGPDMLLIASRSLSQGRSAGLLTFLGIAAGTYCHAMAAALGLAQLLKTVPAAYEVLRWAGCGYLLYLAVKTLRSKASVFDPSDALGSKSGGRIFAEGLATNLLNPKMALFVLALFPQFTSPANGSVIGQMLMLATILNVVGFAVNGTVILIFSRARHGLKNGLRIGARYAKLSQYLLATVFLALASRLAFGSRA